jgi:hypothetical protein
MTDFLPQYVCQCGHIEFEVYSNDYELRLECTHCKNTIFERVDE